MENLAYVGGDSWAREHLERGTLGTRGYRNTVWNIGAVDGSKHAKIDIQWRELKQAIFTTNWFFKSEFSNGATNPAL